LPLVQRLDDASTEAMWSDVSANVVQQRIIRRHFKYHFGKYLFFPQMLLRDDQDLYEVEIHYGSYKHYKNCENDLSKLLDYHIKTKLLVCLVP
jgi:hypothetical protein